MALSDRFLQRSNQSPSSYKEYLMTTDDPTPEGYSGFLDTGRFVSGNLNRTEMDSLRESEPGTGISSEFRELINRLIAAGVPREEILKIIQSRMDSMTTLSPGNLNRTEIGALTAAGESGSALMSPAEGQFGGSPHGEGPFWNQYNQGGIVSLRRLTRPLGY